MTDKLLVQDSVLDGTQLGPVQVDVQTGDTTSQVTVEESVFEGNGSEIIIEVSDDIAITGLDELTELTEDIAQTEVRVNQSIDAANSLQDRAQQQLDEFNNRVTEVRNLRDETQNFRNDAQTAASNAATAETGAQDAQTAAEAARDASQTAQTAAEAARDVAITNRTQAQAAQNASETARDASQAAQAASEAAQAASESSETNAAASAAAALVSQNAAKASEDAALVSQNAARTSELNAGQSETDAQTAQAAAEAARDRAITAETNADADAATATTKAAEALASQQAALVSQNAAKASEDAALVSQNAAKASEDAAEASETAAATSETSAESHKDDAEAAKTAAEAARDRAITAETNSTASQAAAAASQSAAAASASGAATSADNASDSAAAALVSQNAAKVSEDNAHTDALSAGVHETNAATSAAAASTSETNAGTSETNAATSASNASTSEANALTYRNDAETFKNDAQTSQTNAEAARDAAQVAQSEAEDAEANAKASETAAAGSATNAATSLSEAQGLVTELRKGQVYRGTWNPNTSAYPSANGTNSVWDVVVTDPSGSTDFDGKTWESGDRLIYVLDTTTYTRIETGGAVRSVNGDTGAVVVTADSIGAFSPSNLPTWAQVVNKPNLAIIGQNVEFGTLRANGELTLGNGTTADVFTRYIGHSTQHGYMRANHFDSESAGAGYSFHWGATEGSTPIRTNFILEGGGGFLEGGQRVYSPNNIPSTATLGVWSKAEADSRFLGVGDTAADSDRFGGLRTVSFEFKANEHIGFPGGGAFRTTTQNHSGVIAIKLPTARHNSNTMLSFTVTIFNYVTGQSTQARIAGYNHTSGWTRTSAYLMSGSRELQVRWGNDGTRDIVYIGSDTQAWVYPQVTVSDVQMGFNGLGTAWRDGWDITVGTDTAQNVEVSGTMGVLYSTRHKPTLTELGALGASETAVNSNQLGGRTLAQVISDARSGYATIGRSYTKAEADARFLSLSGGTTTGNIRINNPNDAFLTIDAGSDKNSTFRLSEDNQRQGFYIKYLGADSSNQTRLGTRQNNSDVDAIAFARGSSTVTFLGTALTSVAQNNAANALTRKDYVDGRINTRLATTGGVLTGQTRIEGTGTIGLTNDANYWLRIGGASGTSLNFDNNEIWATGDFNIGTRNGPMYLYYNSDRKVQLNGTAFNVEKGQLQEQGRRVYSPNNVPTQDIIHRTHTVVKQVRTSTSWQPLLENSDFTQGSGVYIISVSYSSNAQGGGAWSTTYTGQLYWYAANTNNSNIVEVPLHHMGHADSSSNDSSGEYIFLRTRTYRGNTGDQKLEIRSTRNHTANVSYTVKLARII